MVEDQIFDSLKNRIIQYLDDENELSDEFRIIHSQLTLAQFHQIITIMATHPSVRRNGKNMAMDDIVGVLKFIRDI